MQHCEDNGRRAMAEQRNALQRIDASVVAAEQRCGDDWPKGLAAAIARGHNTSVRRVMARRTALRASRGFFGSLSSI
ncbi:hypothetical protein [Synechococcus sp. UW140]|uniref:hypothetical protein n=1 Tax=Synechococcus sp. UW140 TaxID=368503 RepID=UPI0014836E1A|nr:hypothetical protein [Synechococcus sp. UW140]